MQLNQEKPSSKQDFREQSEIEFSEKFESKGFTIFQGNRSELDKLREKIVKYAQEFIEQRHGPDKVKQSNKHLELGAIHERVNDEENNDLRVYIMNKMSKDICHNYWYYKAAKYGIDTLCGSELAMQRRISLSIQLPINKDDILPIHADTWNGVSPYDLNVWIPLVECRKSMCLYLLERPKYIEALERHEGLLNRDSNFIYSTLKEHMTWIEVEYGQILAFDQSLPHGYSLNQERSTQWSMNCRFKNLFSPYLDKQLGDYYMPITTTSMSKIGMQYEDPKNWFDCE